MPYLPKLSHTTTTSTLTITQLPFTGSYDRNRIKKKDLAHIYALTNAGRQAGNPVPAETLNPLLSGQNHRAASSYRPWPLVSQWFPEAQVMYYAIKVSPRPAPLLFLFVPGIIAGFSLSIRGTMPRPPPSCSSFYDGNVKGGRDVSTRCASPRCARAGAATLEFGMLLREWLEGRNVFAGGGDCAIRLGC